MPHGWTILRKSQACEYAPSAGKNLDEALCAHHNAVLSHHWLADEQRIGISKAGHGSARFINNLIHSFLWHSYPLWSLWKIVISICEYELSNNSELMPSVAFRRINVFIKRVLHIKSRAISCWKPSTIPWRYRHSLAALISTWSKLPFTNSTSLSMVRSHS